MSTLPQGDHNVGRIRLDIDTASFDAALQLRTRAEELAWQRLPGLLAPLFDALCPDGVQLRIERIELDLGDIAAHALEQDFAPRLERALRAALAQAIGAAMHAPGPQARMLALPAARLDEFETYLAGGTLPARGASHAYDPARLLLQLCREQPAALLAMLRRRGHERSLVERLVLQAGAQGWSALLRALAPADAALILDYLAGLRLLQPQVPALRLAQPALERALSVLTLTYLLHDPGSQFNRRTYLAFLLDGVARAEGIAYATLLGLLHAAAERTRASQPLAGSLLGTLDELLAALAVAPPAAGTPALGPAGDALSRAQQGELAPLLQLLHTADPAALAQLVDAMPAPVFAAVVRQLQPLHAALILAHVEHLALLHRQRPRLNLSQEGFELQVRLMALRYLLLEAGSQFNRISWLRRTMHGLAEAAGVSYRFLLDSFAAALDELRARVPLSSSLPEGLAQLVDELGPPGAEASGHAGPAHALLARLRAHGADNARAIALIGSCTPAQLADLAAAIDARHAAAVLDDIAALVQLARGWQTDAAGGGAALAGRIPALALYALLALDTAGHAYDRRLWLRHVLQALAGATRLSLAGLGELLRPGAAVTPPAPHAALREVLATLAGEAAPPPLPAGAAAVTPEAALALAERYLRSGQPQQGGAGLCALAAAHPQGFAALLRRLLVAESGDTDALTQRLLDWMLPEEVVHSLLPGQAPHAARWAEALSELPGASMASAWRQVLAAAWRGEALDAGGAAAWPAQRLDQPALLRHWLDHGVPPWWAADGTRADTLLAGLRSWPLAELHALLEHGDGPAELGAWRLRRLYHQLEADAALELLGRLAPWVLTPGGPLAGLAAGCDAGELAELRIRAAAAAMLGAPLDLARLAMPAPAPAPPAATAPPPAPSGADATQALLAWLAGAAPADTAPPHPRALRDLAGLLAQDSAPLRAALLAGLTRPTVRQQWIAALPEEILARLLYRLAPSLARFMLDLKTVLLAAWRQTAPPASARHPATQLWTAMLDALAQGTPPAQRAIAARLLERLAPAPSQEGRLRQQAQWLASQGGYAHLGAALRGQPEQARQAAAPPAAAARQAPVWPAARSAAPAGAQDGERIYVANAGLVLLHPFLPQLFRLLGLLSTDGDGAARIRGTDDATCAVHLLEYLATGNYDTPEPALALNKLLCGLELDTPVARGWVPQAEQLEQCHQLLAAVKGNWSSIGNTSVAGLRETFLQRDGRLERRDGKWTLTVSRKTVDVLVDQIPWGFAVIFHPWMPRELAVTW